MEIYQIFDERFYINEKQSILPVNENLHLVDITKIQELSGSFYMDGIF